MTARVIAAAWAVAMATMTAQQRRNNTDGTDGGGDGGEGDCGGVSECDGNCGDDDNDNDVDAAMPTATTALFCTDLNGTARGCPLHHRSSVSDRTHPARDRDHEVCSKEKSAPLSTAFALPKASISDARASCLT